MTIKKILVLHLIIMHSMIQSYDWTEKDIQKLATTSIIVTAAGIITYLWATAGDTVEQRIQHAKERIETMSEYEQEFDITMIFGEKETQITIILQQLNISI